MNTPKKLMAFLLPISLISCTLLSSNFFDELDRFIDHEYRKMNKHIKRINKHMQEVERDSQNSASVSSDRKRSNITLEEKDGNVLITLSHVEATDQTINAEFNHTSDTLTVTLPTGSIDIAARDHILSVQHTHKQQVESKKDATEYMYVASSTSHIGKTVSGRPQLAEVNIHYDSETKKITLTIPLEKEAAAPKVTAIPVHKK